MRATKIGIIYNKPLGPGQAHWESSADVLTQVVAVEAALQTLGYQVARILFDRDLAAFTAALNVQAVDCVFNLCETVDEDPALTWHPAAVMELLGVAFSGSPSTALTALSLNTV